jgi:AraC family ethanolamine operon transcriptional activator
MEHCNQINKAASAASKRLLAPGGRKIRVAVANDADDHARNLSRWHQEYDQFSPGAFSGRITELWLPHMQLFLESTNQILHQSCVAWPGALWFGIPVSRRQNALIGTTQIPYDSVAVRRGGSQFELWTPADFDILGIVVDEDVFANYVQDVEHLDCYALLKQYKVVGVDPETKLEAVRALADMLQEVDTPFFGDARAAQQALQDRILMQLVPLLMTATPVEGRVSSTFQNRRRIVRQVREYVLEHPGEIISIPRLCRHFHVSRRTLQYCFEDVVGVSPLSYLRTIRLNEVRRELFFGGRYGQVTEVAMSWGFRHLSQFSIDYQKLFGVLPSQTVRSNIAGA